MSVIAPPLEGKKIGGRDRERGRELPVLRTPQAGLIEINEAVHGVYKGINEIIEQSTQKSKSEIAQKSGREVMGIAVWCCAGRRWDGMGWELGSRQTFALARRHCRT